MGSSFGFEGSLILRGRVNIGLFVRWSVYYIERCSKALCIFFSSLFTLASCTLVLWPFYYIHCTLFSYIWWWCMFFLHLPLHVLFLFSLYIDVSLCMQYLFLFHTWCLDKFCLSVSYHELSFCKVFQEFMLGLDLFCNSTSDYEFRDLRLLSWFILFVVVLSWITKEGDC